MKANIKWFRFSADGKILAKVWEAVFLVQNQNGLSTFLERGKARLTNLEQTLETTSLSNNILLVSTILRLA